MTTEKSGWGLLKDFATQVGGKKLAEAIGSLQSEEGQRAIGNVVAKAAETLKGAVTQIKDDVELELLKARLEALQKKKDGSGPDTPKV
jgi:hypothetical protein